MSESGAVHAGALTGTVLFHLNLAYSSLEERDRAAVVQRCYAPILTLAEENDWLRLALEAPAWTLERIDELDLDWIPRLRALLGAGRVEFVGSGDTQLIGPLVPDRVHRWNQRLGQESYEELLGIRPRVALVNELAWSQGLVDGYLDAGYDHVCMEWNNPRRNHPEWEDAWRWAPVWTEAPGSDAEPGRRIGLLWTDAIAFQKLQRGVSGDLTLEDYRAWVAGRRAVDARESRHLFLYANDAEIFDWRPGRYATEPPPVTPRVSEWERVRELLLGLHEDGVEFRLPGEVAADTGAGDRPVVRLTSAADPVPVKKQPKYNLTRWALSGHDDVGLNTRCFAHAREMAYEGEGFGQSLSWRRICRDWSSDLRTHLTPDRWESLQLAPLPETAPVQVERCEQAPVVEARGRELHITTEGVRLVLDCRRGLAIRELAFGAVSTEPLVATLPHGYFDDIDWSADFYSGHTIVELPGKPRVTDLESVEPRVEVKRGRVVVTAEVPTALGPLPKRISVGRDEVALHHGFSAWGTRPPGSLRTGIATLSPPAFPGGLEALCASGGPPERFAVEGEFDHGAGVSPVVSSRAAFGATDGSFRLRGEQAGVEFRWDPSSCAALPLLAHRWIDGQRWCRVSFSLGEVDETARPGAPLLDFELVLRGIPGSASS